MVVVRARVHMGHGPYLCITWPARKSLLLRCVSGQRALRSGWVSDGQHPPCTFQDSARGSYTPSTLIQVEFLRPPWVSGQACPGGGRARHRLDPSSCPLGVWEGPPLSLGTLWS